MPAAAPPPDEDRHDAVKKPLIPVQRLDLLLHSHSIATARHSGTSILPMAKRSTGSAESVRVAVRFRPLSAKEKEEAPTSGTEPFSVNKDAVSAQLDHAFKEFRYDKVLVCTPE